MDEFNSPALEAAIALHEMYKTFVQAGFTSDEALKIVIEILRSSSH